MTFTTASHQQTTPATTNADTMRRNSQEVHYPNQVSQKTLNLITNNTTTTVMKDLTAQMSTMLNLLTIIVSKMS